MNDIAGSIPGAGSGARPRRPRPFLPMTARPLPGGYAAYRRSGGGGDAQQQRRGEADGNGNGNGAGSNGASSNGASSNGASASASSSSSSAAALAAPAPAPSFLPPWESSLPEKTLSSLTKLAGDAASIMSLLDPVKDAWRRGTSAYSLDAILSPLADSGIAKSISKLSQDLYGAKGAERLEKKFSELLGGGGGGGGGGREGSGGEGGGAAHEGSGGGGGGGKGEGGSNIISVELSGGWRACWWLWCAGAGGGRWAAALLADVGAGWMVLVPGACCLLPAACCLLPAACCLLPAACCLPAAAAAAGLPGCCWPPQRPC
jgi:hypothetical protein